MEARTTWPALIGALVKGESLTADEAAWAMNEIMEGAATGSQIAGFAVALRIKGETAIEVTGLSQAMLDHAPPISVPGRLTDLVGTGADGAHTVNISTMATGVAAAAGTRMVKHGNRAASSTCGAADVPGALGAGSGLPPPRGAGRGDRCGLPVCPAVPPGAAARGRAAQPARRAPRVQLPRTGGQPGPAAGPRDRGGRRPDGGGAGRGAGRPGLQRAGVPRRRRPGRADHHDHLGHLAGPRLGGVRHRVRPGRAGPGPVQPGPTAGG